MRPIDDVFMRVLFRENPQLTQYVLRVITGIQDLVLIKMNTQYDLKQIGGSRSLVLDVIAQDSKGKFYNMEAEKYTTGKEKLAMRARYHTALMNIEISSAGMAFDKLPELYIIFIVDTDIYGLNKPVYPVKRTNQLTTELFDDKETILIVNASYSDETPLGQLLHDFMESDPENMKVDVMRESTEKIKRTQKGKNIMCDIMEQFAASIKRELTEEVSAKKAEEVALTMLKDAENNLTVEQISRYSSLPVDQVLQLKASLMQ